MSPIVVCQRCQATPDDLCDECGKCECDCRCDPAAVNRLDLPDGVPQSIAILDTDEDGGPDADLTCDHGVPLDEDCPVCDEEEGDVENDEDGDGNCDDDG